MVSKITKSGKNFIKLQVMKLKNELDELKKTKSTIEILEFIREKVINEIYPNIECYTQEEEYVDVIFIDDYLDETTSKSKIVQTRIKKDNLSVEICNILKHNNIKLDKIFLNDI